MNSLAPLAFSVPPKAGKGVRISAPRRFTPRLVKFAAAAICLAWLSGCAPNSPDMASDPMTRYPFTVDSELVTQPVVFQPQAVTLDAAEKDRLNAFLIHFFQSGGDVLEIRSTTAADDQRAEARLQALERHILNKGAQPHEIRLRKVAGAKTENGPIILSFESFTVRPIKCTRRNAPTAANPTNMQHPDFGCSLRAGIAAMVANPADLEQPRELQPGDAAWRSRVMQNYRAGQPTESVRGKKEQSNSIRGLGQ